MNVWAIILAAGQSSRLAVQGVTLPKQFLSLEGEPLFLRSARILSRCARVQGLVFVFPQTPSPAPPHGEAPAPPDDNAASYTAWLGELDAANRIGLAWKTTQGGDRRQDSVNQGLLALPPACDTVLVHDAARPFMSPALPARILDALAVGHAAVIPGVSLADTVKRVRAESGDVSPECGSSVFVADTPDRASLRAVQTPQGFSRGALERAHARAALHGWDVTDDAALMERCGIPVLVVPGETGNRKITTVEDLEYLERATRKGGHAMAEGFSRAIPRTGIGYDVHRYGGDRPFILGGVPIPTQVTIAAHSDGDTLLHALMDALLGCIGGGDIGGMFPDTDPAYENISSGLLLAEVRERVERSGFRLTHVDITIIAQTPRVAPYRDAIAKNVAHLLHLPREAVNVKATTEEHLGFTGEKKGIKVLAAATGLALAASES